MWCLGSVCQGLRLYHHIQRVQHCTCPWPATPPPQDLTFLILVQDILDLRDCLLFEHHTTYRPSISSTHKERRPQCGRRMYSLATGSQGRDGYAGVSVFAGSARGTDSSRNP
ncbi:unnamed protein product [Arctogadus glacialis]